MRLCLFHGLTSLATLKPLFLINLLGAPHKQIPQLTPVLLYKATRPHCPPSAATQLVYKKRLNLYRKLTTPIFYYV